MDNFLVELKDTLQKLLRWSETFKAGKRDYNFDIDDELYFLSEKYHEDFKKGFLSLIYTLVDYYCDAVKHDFEKIGDDYPVTEAQDDIRKIVGVLESSEYKSLELPVELVEKLKRIFSWIL